MNLLEHEVHLNAVKETVVTFGLPLDEILLTDTSLPIMLAFILA